MITFNAYKVPVNSCLTKWTLPNWPSPNTDIWISYLKENRFKKEFYEYLDLLKLKLEKLLNGEIIQTFYYENGMGINIQNFKGNNVVDLYYNKA